jgi:riboflavin biosynthesis pyrimidine reductase
VARRADFDAIKRLTTLEDRSAQFPVKPVGNAWSREFFDGPFYVFDTPPRAPAISLVFVQSHDGNTGAANPSDLGGGPTDKHLIYEGLSRVAADGVLAGASSIAHDLLFTVHHPELVSLRLALGRPRHPAQMVLSNRGNIDLSSRMFQTPDVPVVILAGRTCERLVAPQLDGRPWITLIPIGESLAGALEIARRDHGIDRISAIGGAVTATHLVDAGLVQDIYLTTSAIDGGDPDTPWYVGPRRPALETIVQKREVTDTSPLLFEHLAIR